jgi:hypothetical protein
MAENMKKMQIPKALIAHYLGIFVDSLRMHQSGDINDKTVVEECFHEVKLELTKFNEQIFLAAGLKNILDNVAAENLMSYSNQEESLTDEDMEKIVKILQKITRPSSFDESLQTEITNESLDEFRLRQGTYYKSRAGDTLESISKNLSLPISRILENNPFLARRFSSNKTLPEGTIFAVEDPNPTWMPTQT